MFLVTGHRGFIGERLAKKLGSVVGIDLKDGYDLLSAPLPNAVGQRFLEYKVSNPITHVYHLAAQTSVESSWYDPLHDLENIRIAARVAHAYPGAKIIYANSCASLDPKSPYGFSKRAAGQYLEKFHGNVVNCVFPNIYGPGSKSVVDIFKEGKVCNIFGDGTAVRDYVHVDDIVEGLVKAQDWEPGTYYMGSNKGTTVNELALAVKKNVRYLPPRKEEKEVIVENTTPDWEPTIKVLDYIKV